MYSLTRIQEFKTCKLRYYFRYHERAKQTNIMPNYISEGIEAHEIIQQMFIDKIIPDGFFDGYITEKVEKLLNKLSNNFDIEIEKQFYLTRDLSIAENSGEELFLTGKIDVLAKNNDSKTVYVIEFKNGFREKHEHRQILFYLYPYLDYEHKIGITLTPKNYYETEFSNDEIINNVLKTVKEIEEIEKYDNSEDKDVHPKLGSHCITCQYRKRCNAFQGTLMAEIEDQNIVDRIVALEIELSELRNIAREKAKEELVLYSTNGVAYGYKPIYKTSIINDDLIGFIKKVTDKGLNPFEIKLPTTRKPISLLKPDSDAIKKFLRAYQYEDLMSMVDQKIKFYRFEKLPAENKTEEE